MTYFNPFACLSPTKEQRKEHDKKVQRVIQNMGNKWRLHPDNYIKRKA